MNEQTKQKGYQVHQMNKQISRKSDEKVHFFIKIANFRMIDSGHKASRYEG